MSSGKETVSGQGRECVQVCACACRVGHVESIAVAHVTASAWQHTWGLWICSSTLCVPSCLLLVPWCVYIHACMSVPDINVYAWYSLVKPTIDMITLIKPTHSVIFSENLGI